ncbi:penicillin-binding transpeptidase domain-containing protein, partial [bacterium LRH843]|nr:penicillin-binding transpeptidase domain-containing protein [bacterium LRH843]
DVSYKKLSDDQKDDNKKKESTEIPFTAKMNSMAGEISFDKDARLVKEERDKEDNWYIDWDTTYIFADLGADDKVSLETVPAERGAIMDVHEN